MIFLTVRRARQLGLTVNGLKQHVLAMKAEGVWSSDREDRTEMAAMLLERCVRQNPQAFKEVKGPDWDAIIEFIEKLIPLILLLIDLFS